MSRNSIRLVVVGVALCLCSTLWAAAPPKPLVDINRATVRQLKTLPGIGEVQAQRIVEGRPYLSKADLVEKKAIPAGTYLSIKRLIIAKPVGKVKAP